MVATSTKFIPLLKEEYNDPLQNFLYALKAPDSKDNILED
jgi:hypothetical protein